MIEAYYNKCLAMQKIDVEITFISMNLINFFSDKISKFMK